MKGGRCVSKKPTEGNVWRITLANVFSRKLLLHFFMQTRCQTHNNVIYLKLKLLPGVLENKGLRDLSGPTPLVNLHPWEKDWRQILFFCDFGENCVSESLFRSLRTILEVLTHTGEWEVRFIAFLELKTYQKVQKQLRGRNYTVDTRPSIIMAYSCPITYREKMDCGWTSIAIVFLMYAIQCIVWHTWEIPLQSEQIPWQKEQILWQSEQIPWQDKRRCIGFPQLASSAYQPGWPSREALRVEISKKYQINWILDKIQAYRSRWEW